MSILVWLLLLLFRFSSSGEVTQAEPPAAAPTDPSTSGEAFPPDLGPLETPTAIEQRFLTRSPLVACNVVRTDGTGPAEAAAYDCLEQAAEVGDGAELLLVETRADGTAYVYYRVNPDGPVEVFVDQRDTDRGDWAYRRCPVPDDISSTVCE